MAVTISANRFTLMRDIWFLPTILSMIALLFVPTHPAANHVPADRFRMLARPLRRVAELRRALLLLRRRRLWRGGRLLRWLFLFWRRRAIAHTDATRRDAAHPH